MSLERLEYLDHAFKTLGLSLGRHEADEMSTITGRLGLGRRSEDTRESFEESLQAIAHLDHRRLSGRDAQFLVALAQVGVARALGRPAPSAASRILHLPFLGRTAVRIIVQNPAVGQALRIEHKGLEKVKNYVLCEFNLSRPEELTLVGWAGQKDVLASPKVRLTEGGPEAHVIGVTDMVHLLDPD